MHCLKRLSILALLISGSLCRGSFEASTLGYDPPEATHDPQEKPGRNPIAEDFVREAFETSHDGWSVDEVLLQDALREQFLLTLRSLQPVQDEKLLLDALLHLRKRGRLKTPTTRRSSVDLTDVRTPAEMTARLFQDRMDVPLDQILVDPEMRNNFDEIAATIVSHVDPYLVRKAAIQLRKARSLRPELTLRVADWNREIRVLSVESVRGDLDQIPRQCGVYLFRDATGYLYVGQSNDMRQRLGKHLDDSDRKSLFHYLESHSSEPIQLELHLFGPGSPAEDREIREAYESELIRSRKPRFNLAS